MIHPMSRSALRWIARAGLSFVVLGCGSPAMAEGPPKDARDKADTKAATVDPKLPRHFAAEEKTSTGSVTVNKQRIDYRAVAGTLVVHPKGWDDVAMRLADVEDKPSKPGGEESKEEGHGGPGKPITAEASMFYVAYLKQGVTPANASTRPVTFLFNGGPGSATVWLHMGAFGPRRVVVPGDQHVPAAPYTVTNNDWSLLDASDLVFIDAPGAGFSRIAGANKEKSFYGVDQDCHAFADFIVQWLDNYGRWNSPKYLFGESYGTTRSAVLINELETRRMVDFNGVMLLSQILNFHLDSDVPEANPGVDIAYELALPTYAATAWYHKKTGEGAPADLKTLVAEVEKFAIGDYALALQQGSALPEADRVRIADALHKYTGLPVDYVRKANLRINGGEFEKMLQSGTDTATGRIDTRFSGPIMDPLSKESEYDPFTAGIGSAFVSGFNDYVRRDLKFGDDRVFLPFAHIEHWDMEHTGPRVDRWGSGLNVMTDLANAMKYNPNLKVQLNAGYYDLATPFFQGVYEMQHLPMPDKLQSNIEYRFYESGHMVYVQEASLRALHDNAADFIRRTQTVAPTTGARN
jgi:carboxypeptidase C (cathepsin A)